jgi:hypothetical protein
LLLASERLTEVSEKPVGTGKVFWADRSLASERVDTMGVALSALPADKSRLQGREELLEGMGSGPPEEIRVGPRTPARATANEQNPPWRQEAYHFRSDGSGIGDVLKNVQASDSPGAAVLVGQLCHFVEGLDPGHVFRPIVGRLRQVTSGFLGCYKRSPQSVQAELVNGRRKLKCVLCATDKSYRIMPHGASPRRRSLCC